MTQSVTIPKKRRSTPKKPQPCSICAAHGDETFVLPGETFIFDVDLARELTSDGRPSLLLARADVRYAVETSEINERHVPHVDVSFPGIMARVRYVEPDGRVVCGDVLIDGHHRAARCLRIGRPFRVYVLNYDETDRVLTRRPDARRIRVSRTR